MLRENSNRCSVVNADFDFEPKLKVEFIGLSDALSLCALTLSYALHISHERHYSRTSNEGRFQCDFDFYASSAARPEGGERMNEKEVF